MEPVPVFGLVSDNELLMFPKLRQRGSNRLESLDGPFACPKCAPDFQSDNFEAERASRVAERARFMLRVRAAGFGPQRPRRRANGAAAFRAKVAAAPLRRRGG
jgi:hypothetical protein